MGNAKKITKQILGGIGKGLFNGTRWIFREIRKHDERVKREQILINRYNQRYLQIEKEGYHRGKGFAQGMSDVEAINRALEDRTNATRAGTWKTWGIKCLTCQK